MHTSPKDRQQVSSNSLVLWTICLFPVCLALYSGSFSQLESLWAKMRIILCLSSQNPCGMREVGRILCKERMLQQEESKMLFWGLRMPTATPVFRGSLESGNTQDSLGRLNTDVLLLWRWESNREIGGEHSRTTASVCWCWWWGEQWLSLSLWTVGSCSFTGTQTHCTDWIRSGKLLRFLGILWYVKYK